MQPNKLLQNLFHKSKDWGIWEIHPAAFWLIVTAGLLVLAAAVGCIWFHPPPSMVEFLDFDIGAVVSLLLTLFVVTAFVERAVEVVVNIWREPGARLHEEQIKLRKSLGSNATKAAASGSPPADHVEELAAYKTQTARIASTMTFLLGVAAGIAGLRVLQPLVDTDSLASVGTWQQDVFRWLDILVTGALIGGGSEGIHQLMNNIIGAFETSKAYLDARKAKFERDKQNP